MTKHTFRTLSTDWQPLMSPVCRTAFCGQLSPLRPPRQGRAKEFFGVGSNRP